MLQIPGDSNLSKVAVDARTAARDRDARPWLAFHGSHHNQRSTTSKRDPPNRERLPAQPGEFQPAPACRSSPRPFIGVNPLPSAVPTSLSPWLLALLR